jgi:hypothetical protein
MVLPLLLHGPPYERLSWKKFRDGTDTAQSKRKVRRRSVYEISLEQG